MKTIKIKQLSLINFKAIRHLELNFTGDETFIYADNGVGKTTIFDGFNWLLFGKDSQGRTDFEIKTLDTAGKVIEKIEHEVSATLEVDGTEIKLKRVLKENWVKKRGSSVSEFTGNGTEYYWNDVPMQQKEFNSNISQLLDEQIFKLITNVSTFNTMDWKQRRSILSGMVTISDEEIIGQNLAFQKLMNDIKSFKSIEDYKKMKSTSIKKANDDLKAIPTRIDEVNRNKPEVKDFAALRLQLTAKESEMAKIDEQIQDKTKAVESIVEQKNTHTLKLNGLRTKISTLQNTIKNEADKQVNDSKGDYNKVVSEIQEYESTLKSVELAIQSINTKKNNIQNTISQTEKEMNDLRTEWASENSKTFVFDEAACKCPTCNRALETSDITAKKDELLKNFNISKESVLNKINSKGVGLKTQKENISKELNETESLLKSKIELVDYLNQEIASSKAKLETLKEDPAQADKKAEMIYETMLSNNAELIGLNKDLIELEKVTFADTTVDTSELKAQKDVIKKEVDAIKIELAIELTIKAADERVGQLIEEERTLAQQVADVENDIMIADEFNKAKIDVLETKINQKFLFIKFKMFDTQINRGENECCEATINGVPYSDANTASKINAGIDVINTLTEFYNVSAPIFIDNRESIVNVLPTHSQLINLVVSAADKKLRVA